MLLTHSNRFDNSSPLLGIEDTFQSYSSFTTNYLPPQDYESLMVSASKIRGQSIRNLDRRERLETNLVLALPPLIILFLTYHFRLTKMAHWKHSSNISDMNGGQNIQISLSRAEYMKERSQRLLSDVSQEKLEQRRPYGCSGRVTVMRWSVISVVFSIIASLFL